MDEITADDGYKIIVGLIEDAHEYLKDQRLEQAFDEAIFRGRRDRGQTLTTFLTAKKAAFAELRTQGLDLLATRAGRHLLGHLILRQGSFTQDQRQRLKVVTNGSIDYQEIEVAIQKIFGDKLDDGNDGTSTPRRWRSASYWESGYGEDADYDDEDAWDYEDQTYAAVDDDNIDVFEDLLNINDKDEVQMTFMQEIPMVMDEMEALDTVGGNLEEIYYETQQRLSQRGKGKGKKGKGKGNAKTFGSVDSYPGFGKGKGGGGYLEHRRQLQASRTGRGYEKPWMVRQGTRHSLSEIKSRTRCHQCKQVGHWSRECPQRGRSNAPRSNASVSSTSTSMSTGFFTQPPRLANFGHSLQEFDQFLTTAEPQNEQYKERQFCGLSFCFLNTQKSEGTALVDTAAQHGLVGIQTLQHHDLFLQHRFGLQVQWSHESGGTVRGVCGAEETTKIAYVPIGLGGKSGVLRVQVVPGDIPFLLPAYFLSDLGAVIDMKHATIMYMNLGIKQNMRRLHTGHVSVSIVEFGSGFRVPANFAGVKSQAWSTETVPDWQTAPRPHAQLETAMGPVAALVAAALVLHFPAELADYDGGGSNTSAAMCAATSSQKRALGEGSLQVGAGRAACDGPSISGKLYGISGRSEHLTEGRTTEATWHDHGQGQVLGSPTGTFTSLQAQPDVPWSQSPHELSEVPGLLTGAEDATDANCRASQVEQHHGLHARGLPQADDQQDAGCKSESQVQQFAGSYGKERLYPANSHQEQSSTSEERDQGGRRGPVRGCSSVDWRRCGHGDGRVDSFSSHAELQCMPPRSSDAVPLCGNGQSFGCAVNRDAC